jgi:mono/diheme cytochrome c family protein
MRFVLAALLLAPALAAQAAEDGKLARGKYLVERVGMCTDCHSPRDAKGELVRAEWLRGAPIAVKPIHDMPEWGEVAPPLAGLPSGYSEAQLATFLETGKRPDGSFARPPMPPYRFDRADAEAAAAYLRSLK